MPATLYLIDGHALAYRTFYAISNATSERLQTHSGEPVAGVLGFASVMLRLIEQEKPEYLAVAFDTGKTFRDTLFPAYKATRAKMPDDLRSQMDRIRQLVDAFHFPRLEMEGYEADDVLGTIAREAVTKGLGVKIITGDRDLLQLVDDRIIVNLAGNKLSEAQDFHAPEVIAKLGVRPDQVIDYKALVGDHSDNIPGVPGIGEKTALTLLEQFPTLDGIYDNLDKIKPAVRTKLESGRESAYMSRDLATIRTDLHITLDLEQARTDHINWAAVEALFRELEFRNLLNKVKTLSGATSASAAAESSSIANPVPPVIPGGQMSLFAHEPVRIGTPPSYNLSTIIVDTPEALADLKSSLEKAKTIALDTETTSTDPMRADLVGISLAVEEGTGYYIPVGHRVIAKQLRLADVIAALTPALTDTQKPKVGHNLKFDALVLLRNGLEVQPLTFDTMIAEFLINPVSHNLGLKDMADAYLSIAMTHIEELIGKGKNQRSMADVPVADAAPYAAADAEVTFRLMPILQQRLENLHSTHLLEELEMPLIPVLMSMEKTGVALDVPFFHQMASELNQRLIEIEREVTRAVGYSFNLNSTQQLSKVLFETLKLAPPDPRKKTASGHYSTSADVLEELSGKHPVVDLILENRELAKLKSTYVDALPGQINPSTGRVHTSFNQVGAATGRLASSDPNLQNIPTRTDIGRRVRRGFIADPGNVLLSVDYSQIELRIVAHMSGDSAMLDAFRKGQDIHAATAAAIYNLPLEKVTKEQRRHAKTINFGLIYGMSAFGLSRGTDLTLAEAEDFVKAYFQQFPGVKKYLDGMRKQAAQVGYVETLLGRRRYFPNLQSQSNPAMRGREEREAINAPIQGTAADFMKIAMIHLPAKLEAAKLKAKLLLQVHDELVLEVPESELRPTITVVKDVMENAYQLLIPLLTEARSGQNWGEMQVVE